MTQKNSGLAETLQVLLIMENHGIVFYEFLWEPC